MVSEGVLTWQKEVVKTLTEAEIHELGVTWCQKVSMGGLS
jgi:hypothetical protein